MKMASLRSTAPPRSVVNSTPVPVLGQQLGQVLFEDGHAAFAQGLDPGFVIVHADNAMAHFSKANCRNKSHISGPDHTDGNWIWHRLLVSPSLPPAGYRA